MSKTENIYKILKERKGKKTIIEGTLEYLINYFKYTLLIGNSINKKVQKQPKTIKAFIKSLDLAFDEKESACYERTTVSLL